MQERPSCRHKEEPSFGGTLTIRSQPVGGYENPVFFTATAMIGTIALAGIADRNAHEFCREAARSSAQRQLYPEKAASHATYGSARAAAVTSSCLLLITLSLARNR